jgi:hypothetical protein
MSRRPWTPARVVRLVLLVGAGASLAGAALLAGGLAGTQPMERLGAAIPPLLAAAVALWVRRQLPGA